MANRLGKFLSSLLVRLLYRRRQHVEQGLAADDMVLTTRLDRASVLFEYTCHDTPQGQLLRVAAQLQKQVKDLAQAGHGEDS